MQKPLQKRRVSKAINKAIAGMLENWDNPETFDAIYNSAIQMCRWGKKTVQGTIPFQYTPTPQHHTRQLKLF